MQSQLINLGVVLGLVQVSNYLNLEDPEHLIKLRISYVVSQLINLILLLYITRKITKNNDTTPLVYTDPKTPFATVDPLPVTTTFMGYDKTMIKAQLNQLAIGFAFMCFLHLKFGYIRPLFFQTVLGLKNLYSTPLVQIYIFGKQCEGSLLRPWKAPSPFGLPAADEGTPAAVEQAQVVTGDAKKEIKAAAKKELKEQKKQK